MLIIVGCSNQDSDIQAANETDNKAALEAANQAALEAANQAALEAACAASPDCGHLITNIEDKKDYYLKYALRKAKISTCDNNKYQILNYGDGDYDVFQFKDLDLKFESLDKNKLADVDLLNDIKEINSFILYAKYYRVFSKRGGRWGWEDWVENKGFMGTGLLSEIVAGVHRIKNDGTVIYDEDNLIRFTQKSIKDYIDISDSACDSVTWATDSNGISEREKQEEINAKEERKASEEFELRKKELNVHYVQHEFDEVCRKYPWRGDEKPGSHTYQDCYDPLRKYWDDIYPNCTNSAIDTQQKLTICAEKIRILREKMANGCKDCKKGT